MYQIETLIILLLLLLLLYMYEKWTGTKERTRGRMVQRNGSLEIGAWSYFNAYNIEWICLPRITQRKVK